MPQQVVVTAPTLFHVAASLLGDATQWNRIALLNGLTDPLLYGVAPLTIPDADATSGGGIADAAFGFQQATTPFLSIQSPTAPVGVLPSGLPLVLTDTTGLSITDSAGVLLTESLPGVVTPPITPPPPDRITDSAGVPMTDTAGFLLVDA